MKKVLTGICLFVILIIISVFIFIPSELHISSSTAVKANTNPLIRHLSDEAKWIKWWPHENKENELIDQSNRLQLNNFSYHLSKKLYNAAEVEIINKDRIINSRIFIIPLAEDSVIVRWQSSFKTSFNPFIRIMQYQQAVNIKKNMTVILSSFKSFCENKDKTYAFHIYHSTIKDTFYISEKKITAGFPSTSDIYKSIGNLRTYISNQKAETSDFPILNITKKDSVHYEMMVAIPINKILDGNKNIAFKRMIVYKDKILTAEVKGGPEQINAAYNELNTYIRDYNLTVPVIGWETLITDRSRVSDSTKWITRICIPIA